MAKLPLGKWMKTQSLDHLLWPIRKDVSARQAALFALEGCRSIGSLWESPEIDALIATAERLAEGQADKCEVDTARNRANAIREKVPDCSLFSPIPGSFTDCYGYMHVKNSLLCLTMMLNGIGDAKQLWEFANRIIMTHSDTHEQIARSDYICDLMREIFLTRYFDIPFDPAWRDANTVPIAQAMYNSRDFAAAPILADALEDAGCMEAAILDHLRNPAAVHVRGCWAVDMVLGKS